MADRSDPRIEASDVISMFPTFVWKISLKAELRDAMDPAILAALAGMRRDLPRSSQVRAGSRNKRCINVRNFGNSFLASAM